MKKFLLATVLVAAMGLANKSLAQCNGAAVTITGFSVSPNGNTVNYAFDWQFVQGNASIQVVDSCNGVWGGHLSACIPHLKDSAAGVHHVTGTFNTFCNGVYKVAVLVWTNNSCGGTNCEAVSRIIQHTPLPVVFKSFEAMRSHSNVNVRWETASEINNSGFAVERNVNGSWEQIAWVPTQSVNGISDAPLSYAYTDLNANKGISQYRVRQVDIDGKSKYSEIRSVRGDGQIGKIIAYPNPSNSGRVSISFEDANVSRNLTVVDMSGRAIREIKGITNNNITIENLQPGMYTLKVVAPETGEQAVQKIVVNKR